MSSPATMNDKTVFIKEEYFTPEVTLDHLNGKIKIQGRCTTTSANLFFLPLSQWAKRYSENPCNHTALHIYLDLLNTASKIYLIDFIRQLSAVSDKGCILEITWLINHGDEDMLELINHLRQNQKVEVAVSFRA